MKSLTRGQTLALARIYKDWEDIKKKKGWGFFDFIFNKEAKEALENYNYSYWRAQNYPRYFDNCGNPVDEVRADYEAGEDMKKWGWSSREEYEKAIKKPSQNKKPLIKTSNKLPKLKRGLRQKLDKKQIVEFGEKVKEILITDGKKDEMENEIKKGDIVSVVRKDDEYGMWGVVKGKNERGYLEVELHKDVGCLTWFRPSELRVIKQSERPQKI